MGEVYLAWDTRLERQVAVKVLSAEVAADQERSRRFAREARAAAAVRHPGVAHIYEIGEVDGRAFIAMEYVEGESLDARLRVQSVPLGDVVDYGAQAADALEEAHA